VCATEDILPENCETAEDFAKWIDTLSTFQAHLKDSDDLTLSAGELDLIVDAILEEMGVEVDPRTKLYIQDIKVIIQMLLQDESTKASLGITN
jgi:hypothetical protein